MMMTKLGRDMLLARIMRFVETYVPHERGWVKPSKDDFDEFSEICCAIRDAKWARDEDNDPTIQIDMVDRSYGLRPWVPIVPYHEYDKPITEDHWHAASSLLDAANEIQRQARLIMDAHRSRAFGKV
jgi:hypothetical protein